MSEPNGETYKSGSGGKVGRGNQTTGGAPTIRLNGEGLAQWAESSSSLERNAECLDCSRSICRRCVNFEALDMDHNLIVRAQRVATGATIHRFSQALTVYMGSVEIWNRFLQQQPVNVGELQAKIPLRDRALALQLKLRQEVLREELRSKGFVTDDPATSHRHVLQMAGS